MTRRAPGLVALFAGLRLAAGLLACSRQPGPVPGCDGSKTVRASTVESSAPERNNVAPPSKLVRRSPFDELGELRLADANSKQYATVRVYDPEGNVTDTAAIQFETMCADRRNPEAPLTLAIDRRLIQIVAKAAYHFSGPEIEIVSCYRRQVGRKREGLHALGRALDFRLVGVKPAALASYLRRIPKLGVGLYPHRRTQYVHVDVRDSSYHWLDASPPRRTWRELSIGGRGLAALDRLYRRSDDWPEAMAHRLVETLPLRQ